MYIGNEGRVYSEAITFAATAALLLLLLLDAEFFEACVMRLRKLKPSNTDLRELRIVLLALGRKAAHKQAHGLDGRSRLVYLKTVHEAYGHDLIIAPMMMNLAPQHQVPGSAQTLKKVENHKKNATDLGQRRACSTLA